ncbi:MAG TPA: succinyl-diaminopimelate desuccinylase [Actinocrinis sp.]|nr:succinyl-diaminopimelate desuccinylase [Actinocrinis sp.]
MPGSAPGLDLSLDACALTEALVDIPSVSEQEKPLADAIEQALLALPGLTVRRLGENVVAHTDFGLPRRVVLAGHIDTVPIADNVPSRREGGILFGCGTCDMKSGVAVQLKVAAAVGAAAAAGGPAPAHDLVFAFYDCEEIESARNGLGRIAREHPDWLAGDFAVLLEPTDGVLEGGCQGTLRARIALSGKRAHSARSWLGDNAIHHAAPVLARLAQYRAREVEVDGLLYHEGLNAVGISGGVAGNVIPDECSVVVNFRFAPHRSEQDAAQHVREVFEGYPVEIVDSAPAARPGLTLPAAASFAALIDAPPRAKYGWTDVARFSALGVPAVNYGPGDPNQAHTRDEHVDLARVREAEALLLDWCGLAAVPNA